MITSFFKITSFDWACMMDQTPKYYTPYLYIHFCILQTQQSGGVGINTGILYTQHLRHGDVGWLASNHTAEPKFKSDPSHKDGKPNSSIISPSFENYRTANVLGTYAECLQTICLCWV